jgi:hypothetical protein
MIPGMAVLIVDFAFAMQGHVKHAGLFVAAYSLIVAGIFIGVAKLNSNAARKLQKRIDELDEAKQ